MLAKERKYYAENKNKILADKRKYRSKNKTKIRAKEREYRLINKDEKLAKARKYYMKNRDNLLNQQKKYRSKNKGMSRVYNATRRAKKQQAIPLWYEKDQVRALYKEAGELNKLGVKNHVDHIVPLNSKYVCGLHCIDNLEIVDPFENISKHNRHWPDM